MLKSIRAARPDGAPIYVILDNLSAHKGSKRHPDVLAAQRKERARIRSEKGLRWGGRPLSGSSGLTIQPGDRFRSPLQAGADEPECGRRVRGTSDSPAHDNM